MSRPTKFPLVRSLLRAAEDARLNEQQLEAKLESSISRRSFLKSATLVAGVTAYDFLIPNISWSSRLPKSVRSTSNIA